MTQPVDVAYVDIVVREKSLAKVKKDIRDALDDIDKDLTKTVDDIDQDLTDVFNKMDAHFKETAKVAEREFRKVSDSVDDVITRIGRGVPGSLNGIQRAFRGARSVIGNAVDSVQEHLESAFRRIGTAISGVIGLLGQLGGLLLGFVTSSPLLLLILALIPPIIALAAALSSLIGLVGILPAGLGILIASIVPVVVAFQNFGEAVAALASGDIEKINEALAKLAPSARLVAREVAAALPTLREFQRVLQEAFFSQVRGSFTQLATVVLPQLRNGLAGIAVAVGNLVASFVQFLTLPGTLRVFNELFATTAQIITNLTPPLIRFIDAIGAVVQASLPFIERLAAAFNRALDSFTAFINKSVETGAFDRFIEDAITTTKELLDLLKAIGGLIGTIFAGTEESGHDFLQTLTDITNQLNEFFKSAEGQRTLRDLVFIVKTVGESLRTLALTLEFLILSFHTSIDVFKFIGRLLADVGAAIGKFFSSAIAKLREFVSFIGSLPSTVVSVFDRAVSAVGNFLRGILAGIREFGAFLASIPTLIGNAIKSAFDRALFIIGVSIGLILFAIQVLPGKIVEFVASLPERIEAIFTRVRDIIVNAFTAAVTFTRNLIVEGFEAMLAFASTLPERLGLIFTQIKDLIVNAFVTAVTFVRDTVVSGFNSVVSFIASVPDRIRELIPIFARAGKNLIESFMNGFRSVGSFIGDIAGDIVGAVRSFLNRAIDKINSGIASIDAILPGDLGRIPRLAAGAVIRHRPGGILANVGEGSEDEVVAPLSKLASTLRSLGFGSTGTGITFGAGAINVNFSGVVPTPDEARATGQAVGEGIISTLARRNLRAQVRAI